MEQPKAPKNKKPNFKFNLYWIYSIIAFTMFGLFIFSPNTSVKDENWSKFEELARSNSFSKITVYSNKKMLEATLFDSSASKVFSKDELANGAKERQIKVSIPSADKFNDQVQIWKKETNFHADITYKEDNDFMNSFLWSFGPLILIAIVWFYFMRRMSGQGGAGGGVFNVGKAKAQIFDKASVNKTTFKDVAGLSEAKQEVEEIVEFLRNPSKFTELGGKIPKGALLIGPPGTGKTLLAKAVAGEADVPFFSLSGSDFVEMFVGVGASRVRDLFRQAKEKAPCIIFIDEIDAVGRARGKNPSMGGNDERENTLNQLLTEMDGFGTNSGIIVMAATNRVDILDKALLRAGRFDRQINVDLPDINDRKAIFGVHLRPIKIDESVNIEFLARQTPGFSGADIANVCNEAALIAARGGKSFVEKQDFTDAVDRIVGGLEKKTKITTEEERTAISIHESGHATLSWFLEHASPLIKVTIVPRGRALGAAWYLPEERQITTKEQMLDEMCATLGGRAAEELFLGRISTGAINDLERVSKQAYAMIAYYGMSDKLPNLCYYDSTGQEYAFTKPYSENTAQQIDKEVSDMISQQYNRAKEMLTKYKDGHASLTKILLEKEVIFKEDLEKLFGERAWKSRTEEILIQDEAKEKAKLTLESESESSPEETKTL
ncbi:MAG: ATP-dependent zinc metalloprotease FtsH [Bacteroidales bacterium]|nr:ATP-dependent zinc metalloprotease FtsH [Bacteroidales bacterium]